MWPAPETKLIPETGLNTTHQRRRPDLRVDDKKGQLTEKTDHQQHQGRKREH